MFGHESIIPNALRNWVPRRTDTRGSYCGRGLNHPRIQQAWPEFPSAAKEILLMDEILHRFSYVSHPFQTCRARKNAVSP